MHSKPFSALIKVIELGPFGCRIVRGEVKDVSYISEGFKVVGVEEISGTTVYVEPVMKERD